MSTTIKKPANPWFTCPRPSPQASLRLFCFPYAGGSALIYRNWPDVLPKNIEVCLLHLPGRGNRLGEKPFSELLPLVEAIAEAIVPYLDKPFAFFGHSMGALIGFELARYLRRQNKPLPSHLFISGRTAPQVPDNDPATYDLPHEEFVRELQRLNGTPKEVLEHPELMHLIVPLLRADFSVCQTYSHAAEPAFNFPITVFGGLQDYEVPREHLEPWSEHTLQNFKLRMIPGDHFFLNSSQPLLLQALSQELFQTMKSLPKS
jgi:medium-chain acyl-[acyl-carrier-protein] hydrolase